MYFISTYNNLLKPFSFANFFMKGGCVQGVLRKNPAPSEEQLKRITLKKLNWKI